MPDNFYEACKSQLLIDAATVRNVTNIKRDKSINIRKFTTSSTACSKIAIPGAKESMISFDVLLSEEEDIEDLIDIGDEVTLTIKYYTPDSTLQKTVSQPVVIEKMSDEISFEEGGVISVNVSATSNGTETIT